MSEEAAIAEPLARLRTLDNAIGHIEAKLAPILAMSRDEFVAGLTPLEKAKVDVALAYALSSLFFVLLKVNGGDPTNHEVMGQIKRVGAALKKVKAKAAQSEGSSSSSSSNSSSSSSSSSAEPVQRLRVDAEAGKRVVTHALASNSVSTGSGSLSSSTGSPGGLAGEGKRSADGESPAKEGKQGTKKKKKNQGK